MAQLRMLKGVSAALPDVSANTEGTIFYTYDDSLFHLDYKNENGKLVRKTLNAEQASKDADGNDIVVTYETKIEVERKLEYAKAYTDIEVENLASEINETTDALSSAINNKITMKTWSSSDIV